MWCPDDLKGAVLAVGTFEDERDAIAFTQAARDAGVLVNLVDRPSLCDFAFGSIVNRSPLVIGISTDGAAPALAQALRVRIETMVPRGLKRWAEAAKAWRAAIQAASGPQRCVAASGRLLRRGHSKRPTKRPPRWT